MAILEKKALVVDDDASIRTLVKRILERSNFSVDVAQDGGEGIQKLRDGDYGVIVLDLMMPVVDGAAVIDYIREEKPDVMPNVIVMTAFGASAINRVCPPVARFLAKPFEMKELVRHATECVWLTAADC